MNKDKISSEDVPQKFAEWLLSMGCPADKIPPVDKLNDMCRGQYYMVWRSMMEHVEPKDTIRHKRLEVFSDDMRRLQAAKSHETNVLVPAEYSTWRDHEDLQTQVTEAEHRVSEIQKRLSQAMDKVSTKLAQRNLAQYAVENSRRRVWLLQTVAEELRIKRENLEQAKGIADSLCHTDGDGDVQNKLEKCLPLLMKAAIVPKYNSTLLTSTASATNVASASFVSNSNDSLEHCEEQLSSLSRCSAHELWTLLHERRASLVRALSCSDTERRGDEVQSTTPRSILAHNASLHSNLCLNTIKHGLQIKRIKKRLANALQDLNVIQLSNDACELLVLRSEKARTEARLNALKVLMAEVTSRAGIFAPNAKETTGRQIGAGTVASVDKTIIAKKNEIKMLLSSMAKTERKIQNVRESLETVFGSFHNQPEGINKYHGIELDLPIGVMSSLRDWYTDRRKHRAPTELSLNLDASDNSCPDGDPESLAEPSFTDELKIYLKKFNLENNRKLVLESGENIWIFETLQSSVRRLHTSLLSDDMSCTLVCPSVRLSDSVRTLSDSVLHREGWGLFLEGMENRTELKFSIDLTPYREQEDKQTDKIKKRLSENVTSLQKSDKLLELGKENLRLWSESAVKKYVSCKRSVNGKTYTYYEAMYLGALNPVV